MKKLTDFIKESFEKIEKINESSDSKEIKFNFKDLENAKETIESLESMDFVTKNSDDEISIKVSKDNVDKLDTIVDILQQYCDAIRHSSKRSSSEQYAQKTVTFEKTLASLHDAIDEFSEEETSKEEDKKEDETE